MHGPAHRPASESCCQHREGMVTPLVVWYAVEALLAYAAGWPFSLRIGLLCILRDALLPLLWIAAWTGNKFEWRGNE